VVLYLYWLGVDGAVRVDLARPRRIHGRWRVCDGDAVELRRSDAADRHTDRRYSRSGSWSRRGLSLLPAADHGPLLCPTHPGPRRVRQALHRRLARIYRRLAGNAAAPLW